MNPKLLLLAACFLVPAPLPAEILLTETFSYDISDMTPLAGESEGEGGQGPWKCAISEPATRLFLSSGDHGKALFVHDIKAKPREEIYARLEGLALQSGGTIYYGATITVSKANDNPESGRLLSFSTSDKRGDGLTRARFHVRMIGGELLLGVDADGNFVEATQRFSLNTPLRIVVSYTPGEAGRLWAGNPKTFSEDTDMIAESPSNRKKEPFSCLWIGIPSNSYILVDDLVVATTWQEAAGLPK